MVVTSCLRTLRPQTLLLGCLSALALACSGEIGPASTGEEPGGPGDPNDPSFTPGNGSPTSPGSPSSGGPGTPSSTGPGTDASGNPLPPSTTVPGTPTIPGTPTAPPIPSVGGTYTLPLSGSPIYSRMVRLTHPQWERSVRELLKLDGPTDEVSSLAEDVVGLHAFSNNEINLDVSPTLWGNYQGAASRLAAQVAGSQTALSRIYSGTDSGGFIASFGRKAFRRPLTSAETTRYQEIFDTGAALRQGGASEFARGAGLVIEAMLQSPHFLYRAELGPAGSRLSGYEAAAKLSLSLHGITPDDGLLDAAERGALDSDTGISSVASEMLANPDATEVMRAYYGELFHFNRFLTIEKDRQSVSEYSSSLNTELQEAAYLYFDRLFEESLGVREMLTSTTGFVSPALARFYDGVSAPSSGFRAMDLGPERPGYFTQLPFLILNSINMDPDAIHRGVALNLEILCVDVPPPVMDENADLSLPPTQPGQTNRERVDTATGEGTCGAGCHSTFINPLGFAFENYDGLGRLRTTDNGKPVDTSASYPFAEGALEFSGAAELMQIIADGQQAHACYAKHLASFYLQRDLNQSDRGLIDSLTATSQGPSSSIKQLLLSLVTDPAFTTRVTGVTQ